MQYILGTWEFYYNSYLVRRPVLIPRQETEYAIDLILQRMREYQKTTGQQVIRVLEVGVGSGCIGVSLVDQGMENGMTVEGTGIDIKTKCVQLARLNRDRILKDNRNSWNI